MTSFVNFPLLENLSKVRKVAEHYALHKFMKQFLLLSMQAVLTLKSSPSRNLQNVYPRMSAAPSNRLHGEVEKNV